jgi:hypothetical protein
VLADNSLLNILASFVLVVFILDFQNIHINLSFVPLFSEQFQAFAISCHFRILNCKEKIKVSSSGVREAKLGTVFAVSFLQKLAAHKVRLGKCILLMHSLPFYIL